MSNHGNSRLQKPRAKPLALMLARILAFVGIVPPATPEPSAMPEDSVIPFDASPTQEAPPLPEVLVVPDPTSTEPEASAAPEASDDSPFYVRKAIANDRYTGVKWRLASIGALCPIFYRRKTLQNLGEKNR